MKNKLINLILTILSLIIYIIYLYISYIRDINYIYALLLVMLSSILLIIRKKQNTNIILFLYYIIFILNLTILTRHNYINSYNFIPLKLTKEILYTNNIYFILVNLIGNFIMFMPFEYFLIELFNIKRTYLNILLGILFVTIIEILQYVLKVGFLDIDDIIICSSGMILFYFVYNKMKEKNIFNKWRRNGKNL